MQGVFLLQLYMAPVTNSQRYHDSIYFWRDVYGIKSELNSPLSLSESI
jgi:type I protein arginine methyltransferase